MKKNESKYFYSAELMNKALLALLEKNDIEFITVTEIAKKAGVNRSTFYLHYDNVYELLEETIENLNKQFVSSFTKKVPNKIKEQSEASLISDDFLIPYLNYVKLNKRILKTVYEKPQLFQSKTAYKKMYDNFLYPAISCFITEENAKIYNLEFFIGGVSAIVHKWLELDCQTEISEMAEIIKKCIYR
ncbi:MAG: TetR/AcrR family transcriptional regulator C-terminal domain-containing protein [Clostridia bacterium]|nr:TetR/AcrR family transcriptional regulator C-terminal domain-containing protein [Clostridia bacterium]